MSDYRVALGHDVALISLTPIDPQPSGPPARPTRRDHAADGSVIDQARYVELEWNALGSAQMYQDLLAQFGLDSALYADVTVYVRDGAFNYTRWNGIAVRPEPGRDMEWERGFPKRIRILIKNLEPAA